MRDRSPFHQALTSAMSLQIPGDDTTQANTHAALLRAWSNAENMLIVCNFHCVPHQSPLLNRDLSQLHQFNNDISIV